MTNVVFDETPEEVDVNFSKLFQLEPLKSFQFSQSVPEFATVAFESVVVTRIATNQAEFD